ncbi:MAG: 4-alpha-glucanotransferase [Ardenticatenaceae bacterium]|nr:4-alpha-glucanotransferase [Anaerolineales bacterium]MCB8922498.1 4-alpha-glucanotransferase [Ardenticatenaceae bacterium]MCB8989967.1 4-alpha-glucanotransferase [Ardenticatenaceae bacterium]
MRFARSSGVLVHPTSFPGRYGVGDLGDAAYRFVDFLVEARQSLWQILPLGPTGYADSPYQCFSAFAGNPLLISPDRLVAEGFLPETAVSYVPPFPNEIVDYGPVIAYKNSLLTQAYEHFSGNGSADHHEAFEQFCGEQAYWLDDFALFMAVKNYHADHEGGVWNTWPADIARREPAAMKQWSEKLAEEVSRHKFLQFLFFRQWLALKQYANERDIQIVGDIPIFVAYDSADVWANPDLFFLNEDGSPQFIAGVPPDYFSATGQRWGNPLYRWARMAKQGYAWWVKRLQMTFTQADIVRIDHFRGFDAYWEIPAEEPTAIKGRWVKGPGADFFRKMREQLGDLPIIAEDLGLITREVKELRDAFDFPGMKILQFAFGGERNSDFLPHNFATPNCVVYTGTHDNDTTVGWYASSDEWERDHVRRYLAVDGRNVAWDMIRLAWMSVADTAVATMQDLMQLGTEARMNFPGKTGGYWRWRYTPEMLHQGIASRLHELTELYGRIPSEQAAPAEVVIETEEV